MNDKRLFVGGISFKTSEEALTEAFAQAGTVVSARIITDRETGRSKGFGFVEMETPEEAQAAIDMWNEKELDGREVVVNIAKSEERRSSGPRDGGRDSGGRDGGWRR